MKTLFALAGKKRTGKSTLAGYLARECAIRGWTTEEISLASPIKAALSEIFIKEVPYSTFRDDARKQDKIEVVPGFYMTVRQLLQKFGTEGVRDAIHSDFWLARAIAKIKNSSNDIIVVPDVRFENELTALKKLGTTIYIERPQLQMLEDPHPSEAGLYRIKDDFDIQWTNWEDKKDDLRAFAADLIKRL